uniref:Uncharacterized protein n=1 Tax=Cannabis sativa TaxID=3483 RepID=A0A803PL43_CANSA
MLDRAAHIDLSWDLTPLNSYDIFEITRSKELSEYYGPSSPSSSDTRSPYGYESKRPKTKANMRKSSNQLIIDADKSLEVGNEVCTAGIEVSTAGIVEKRPTGSAHQVKFSSSRPEMVLL